MVIRRVFGDLYCLDLPGGRYAYLQHIADDATQLGSAVVAVFPLAETPTMSVEEEISCLATRPVAFFAHVLLKAGETLGVWRKVGRMSVIDTPPPIWRKCTETDWSLKISNEWILWRTNGPEKAGNTKSPEFNAAELGVVLPPAAIQARLLTGGYQITYPQPA